MNDRPSRTTLFLLVFLAFGLWMTAFAVSLGNFWIKISLSAAVLASLSLIIKKEIARKLRFGAGSILIGIAAAAVLYFIFMIGRLISFQLFGFAGEQIRGIYGQGAGTPPWTISFLLFFVTGPSEEIFWRGCLQKSLQERLGGWRGYLIATSLYAGVHICSLNFMLIGAAAVAGSFWGVLYWGTGNLAACIISHSVWSTVIFAFLPLN